MYLSIHRKHTADTYIQKLRMGIEKTQIEFITNLLPNNITENKNKQITKQENTYKLKWNRTKDKPNDKQTFGDGSSVVGERTEESTNKA